MPRCSMRRAQRDVGRPHVVGAHDEPRGRVEADDAGDAQQARDERAFGAAFGHLDDVEAMGAVQRRQPVVHAPARSAAAAASTTG